MSGALDPVRSGWRWAQSLAQFFLLRFHSVFTYRGKESSAIKRPRKVEAGERHAPRRCAQEATDQCHTGGAPR